MTDNLRDLASHAARRIRELREAISNLLTLVAGEMLQGDEATDRERTFQKGATTYVQL